MTKTSLRKIPRILDSCSGCGYCFLLCPRKAVETVKGEKGLYRVNERLCNSCDICMFACPVDAIEHPFFNGQETQGLNSTVNQENLFFQKQPYDAIIIGSGIGGLLAAASLSKSGKKVILVERLNFIGGRFTDFLFEGVKINSGAFHILPHGVNGPFAKMIKSLNLPVNIYSNAGLGSLYVNGRQFRWKRMLDVLFPFSFWDRVALLKILLKMQVVGQVPADESFEDWLNKQSSSMMIRSFFERMINFGCSSSMSCLTFNEVRMIIRNVYKSGFPGIIRGGCGNVVNKLAKLIKDHQGDLLTVAEATELLVDHGAVTGVRVLDRKSGTKFRLNADLVVSDIGPQATCALIGNIEDLEPQKLRRMKTVVNTKAALNTSKNMNRCTDNSIKEASGLCIRFLSDMPLLSHGGIMLCLDTARVTGIVQPTALDPGLAPQGKHLLIAHQLLMSPDIEKELDLGLSDLGSIFGDSFNQHCRVLSTGVFKKDWPVNRAVQGYDSPGINLLQGLYLVGDGCKSSGYVMVEGIAKQVTELLSQII